MGLSWGAIRPFLRVDGPSLCASVHGSLPSIGSKFPYVMIRPLPRSKSISHSNRAALFSYMNVRRGRHLTAASLAYGAAMLTSTGVFAFCRQNSCEDGIQKTCDNFDDPDDCVETEVMCERDEYECIIEGNTLHRTSPCMSFAVARGNTSLLGLTDNDLLDIVQEAFNRWRSVDCGAGEPPGFEVPSLGLVNAKKAYYCSEADLNTNTWFLSRTWTHDPKALGFTFSTSNLQNGEVHDADVELNLGKIQADFARANWKAVLLSIAMHEAGHFLGLAHSADPNAVMFAAYNRSDLYERELQQDDLDGICDIFPPNPSLVCEPAVLHPEGLDEASCAAAKKKRENESDDATSSDTNDDAEGDPLGQVVARPGCHVGTVGLAHNDVRGVGALLFGLLSLWRVRSKR